MRQKGFVLFEGLLILIAFFGIGFAIWYSASHQSPTHGWSTFKSSVSTAKFKYPPNWRLINTRSADIDIQLESYDLQGPNNFLMTFEIDKPHFSTTQLCVAGGVASTTHLGNDYDMVLQGTPNSINDMYLMAKNNADYKGGTCVLSFYPNQIDKTKEFVFSGTYGSVKTQADFLAAPEVKTAKQIFSSFGL